MPFQGSRGGNRGRRGSGGGGRDGSDQDEEAGKLFVGGLSWETTQESLKAYFSRYGDVSDCVVMKNAESGRSRGFGFVTFTDPSNIEVVMRAGPHQLDNRTIDPKACNPRSMQKSRKGSSSFPKVFLGGLPSNITETDLRGYFSRFGNVIEVVIMYDQEKKKSRGFGFLSYETEDSVERCVQEHFVTIQGKQVELKRAEPRDKNQGEWSSVDSSGMGNGVSQMHSNPAGMHPGMGYQGWGAPPGGQGYPQGYGQPQGYQGWGTPPQGQPPAQWGSGYPGQQSYGYDPYRGQSQSSGPTGSQQGGDPIGSTKSGSDYSSGYAGGQYGSMGNYPQETSSYGPARSYGQDGSQGPAQYAADYSSEYYPGYGASSGSQSIQGGGPPSAPQGPGPQRGTLSTQPGQASGYHPYRRS